MPVRGVAVKSDSRRSDITTLSRLPEFCEWDSPASRSHVDTPSPQEGLDADLCRHRHKWPAWSLELWPKLAWRVLRPSHGIHP